MKDEFIWEKYFYVNETSKEDVIKRIQFPILQCPNGLPSTPILANHNTGQGSIYACAILEPQDSVSSLLETFHMASELSANGAGVSIYMGNIRAIGSKCADPRKEIDGIMNFIKAIEANITAFSQGGIRKGAGVVWLDVWHPEIEAFISLRKPIGDVSMKCEVLNLGIIIDNEFIDCVYSGKPYRLRNPKTYIEKYGEDCGKDINAKELLEKICEMRLLTGQPFIMFKENIYGYGYKHEKDVKCSNLCTEVLLGTNEKHPVALCCLGSIDLFSWAIAESPVPLEKQINSLYYYLKNLRKTIPSDSILKGKTTMCESVGIGFSGIIDLYNYYKHKHNRTNEFWNKIHSLSYVVRKLKEKWEEEGEDGCCFAIAPNSTVSQLFGDVSPGVMPFLNETIENKMYKSSRFEATPKFYSLFPETKGDEKFVLLSRENANETVFSIVQHLTRSIDQGISYTTTSFSSETTEEAKKTHFLHILRCHEAGIKTLYYHKTVEHVSLLEDDQKPIDNIGSSYILEAAARGAKISFVENECSMCAN